MENKYLEYKSDVPEKQNQLKAEIVSFLNSQGGTILLGVDDKGNKIQGSEKKYKSWEELISNWVMHAFRPTVIGLIEIKSNGMFAISIKEGKEKPYYFTNGEGFNAKGVYVRVGSTKRLATYEEMRRMMLSSKSSEYEKLTSENQDLTFKYVESKFQDKEINFDIKGSSLINKEGKYNNAALFLSDQNPTISKLAIFQGTDVSVFMDKKEFKGSIMKQLDELLYFSYFFNKKKIVKTGRPQREEYEDIPPRALREAICNCFCHRDYSLSGDIKVEFYADRVMIFSPGPFPDGLSLEDIKRGAVAKRNQIIVDALDRANYVENYATGVRKIFEDYEGYYKKPEYEVSENLVTLTLYNRNYNVSNEEQYVPKNVLKNVSNKSTASKRQKHILDILVNSPHTTITELSNKFKVSEKTIKRDIEKLKSEGKIVREGSAYNGVWSTI